MKKQIIVIKVCPINKKYILTVNDLRYIYSNLKSKKINLKIEKKLRLKTGKYVKLIPDKLIFTKLPTITSSKIKLTKKEILYYKKVILCMNPGSGILIIPDYIIIK